MSPPGPLGLAENPLKSGASRRPPPPAGGRDRPQTEGDTRRSWRLTSTIIGQASIHNYEFDVIRHPTNFITYLFTGLLI